MIVVLYCHLALAAVLSVVTFVVYGYDKRQAQQDRSRIPEKSLHWLAVLGGWPGALLGQKTFRHKTQKATFQIVFWLTVAMHVILTGGIVYLVI